MTIDSFISYLGVIIAIIVGMITVFIYKLQLYKNTTLNVKKKKMICNVLMLILLIPLCIIFYMMKFPEAKNIFKNNDENNIIEETKSKWEVTYNQFITNYYNFIMETTGDKFESERCKFALYDVNKDKIPELFTCYNGIDYICSYDIEKDNIIIIPSPFFSYSPILYADKHKNELIVKEYLDDNWKIVYTVFYKNFEPDNMQLVKQYNLCEIIFSKGDIEESRYYYENYICTDSYELNKESYEQEVKDILYDKNEIMFYSIKDIKDSDLLL